MNAPLSTDPNDENQPIPQRVLWGEEPPIQPPGVVLRGDKKCPHGHTARKKCPECDHADEIAEKDAEIKLLVVTLRNLHAEVAGLMRSKYEIAEAIGVTNWNVLMIRRAEASTALAAMGEA